jgi:hypothetical protein
MLLLVTSSSPWWVLALVLLVLLLVVVVGVVWWRRRSGQKSDSGADALRRELAQAWRPVWKSSSALERQLGTVILALGEEAWGRSGTLARLAGASAAQATTPSGVRAYRGSRAAVLEVPDALLANDDSALGRAFGELAKSLPSVVWVSVGVDVRELHEGASRMLDEWARAAVRTLACVRSSGRVVGVKVCVTGLESEPGYEVVRELWLREVQTPLGLDVVLDGARLRELSSRFEAQLTSVLAASPEQFDAAVRLSSSLPKRLSALAAFARPLSEAPGGRGRTNLDGVFLADAEGRTFPELPFAVGAPELAVVRANLRSAAWTKAARRALIACGVIALAFVAHGLWIASASAHVAAFGAGVKAGPRELERSVPEEHAAQRTTVSASKTEASPAGSAGEGQKVVRADEGAPRDLLGVNRQAEQAGAAVRGLRFWALPLAFRAGRAELTNDFVEATREAFILPLVRSKRHFAGRVFATALDLALPDNEFGELVLQHPERWASALHMPVRTVSDFVNVRREVPRPELTLRDLDSAAQSVAEWRKIVLELTGGIRTGVFSPDVLSRAKENPLLRELPATLADLRLLEHAVGLIATQLSEERSGTTALEEELQFVARNLNDLTALRGWLDEAAPLGKQEAPTTLAELMARLETPKEDEATQERVLEVEFDSQTERVSRRSFLRALESTKARTSYRAFLQRRCGSGATEEQLVHECPYAQVGYDGSAFFPEETQKLDRLAVRGSASGSYGPGAELPGRYTREAYDGYVAPALNGLSERLERSALPPDDLRGLMAFAEGHADAYGERVFEALRAYFLSSRFVPVSLSATRAAIEELAAPGSWFSELVTTVARHADLPAEGEAAAGVRGALRPLAGLVGVERAKGLEAYGKLLLGVLSDADAREASAAADNKRLGAALGVLGALEAATGEAALGTWLDTAQVTGVWREPFERPLRVLRQQAMLEIRSYWYQEVVRPALPILRQYPFSPGESAVSVDAVTEEFGPEGRLWKTTLDVLSPIVVAKRSRESKRRREWAMRPHLPEPDGLLDYLRAAERLTTLLWSESGEPRKLAVGLTPLSLPGGTAGEPLIALAHLSLAGAGVQSFNQVSDETVVDVEWWSGEASSLSVEVLDEHASELEFKDEAAFATGPWSFLRLLDGGCSGKAGAVDCDELAWPVKKLRGHPTVRFELAAEIGPAFRELRRLSDEAGERLR